MPYGILMEAMETENLGAPFALTPNRPLVPTKTSRATWAGLFVSLFAMVVIRQVFVFFVPEITFASAVLKEALIWVSAVTLLVIVRRGERLPMRSIGLGTARWWMSILWGLVIAVVSAAVVVGLAYLTGYGHGPGSAAFEKLPLWLITLIVFRAGVVEELFYRGYAIERLQMIGLGRFWSVTIPLVIFSLGHWSGGAANILIALAAGMILTGFYLWRRDLVANMIGHGLVDFVANVLPRLFS
ncbi:MAG: CPBP family intramembrane glutamic endopeptidase [Candidatus Udaeobacter sp.]